MLYLQSSEQNNPLALIDCSRLLNSRNWDYLMQDMNSPLSDTGTTIYIRNIDLLPEAHFKELLYTIKDTGLHKRNRIIFELSHKESTPYPDRFVFTKNILNCVTIEIPPLRETKEYIPHMAGLFIGTFNVDFGKEIAGFEPEALNMLQEFDWPFNYAQLRRVITRLGNITEEPFIKSTDVRKVLLSEEKEARLQTLVPSSSEKHANLNLHRTLEEINREIVELVVKEEGGNQSAAARRLGISRTTLWRILKL